MIAAQVNPVATGQSLQEENACWDGTAGVSAANRRYGFHPAFLDTRAGTVYLSRFADGQPAPFHLLDGLPEELVIRRTTRGCLAALRRGVISGFVLAGSFYTRAEAIQLISGLQLS
jgi:hypothetical protein